MSNELFDGFTTHWIDTEAGRIFARSKGDGPPVVLLHGFPQTHVMWHRIAPALAAHYRVVCMDLRGYGWSSVPRSDASHHAYSKRTMGRDVVAVMEALGHVRFAVVGHDRGARVGYRLALDQPGRVERLALLDILPTFHVWSQIRADPTRAPHWRYLAEPYPKPETEIGRDPIAYVEELLAKWSQDGSLDPFDVRALASYRASCNETSRIHAFCEDYRAGATVDVAADEADLAAGRKISCPTLLLWSEFYLIRGEDPDSKMPLEVWRRSFAPQVTGAVVKSGHFVAEENPEETLAALEDFLGS
jgi:haloacetate dehalogenase